MKNDDVKVDASREGAEGQKLNSFRFVKKTRKRRVCCWCSQAIELNAACARYVGTWEGDFFSVYFHRECAAACDAVCEEDGEWTAYGDYARGRCDDRVDMPPEFSAEYCGRAKLPEAGKS